MYKEEDDMLQGLAFGMMGEIDTRQAAIDVEKMQQMELDRLREKAEKLNEEYRQAAEVLSKYTEKTDEANSSTKEFANQLAEGTADPDRPDDKDDKDITKTQLADYQQFLNERASIFGEDTERQLDLLADQTNKMTELYDQQGLDVNDVIDFYTEKRRQILEDDGRRTVETYSKIATGFSSFIGEFAGGQKAAARIQQTAALINAYSTANALMADPKLVAAFPLNIVSAASALATGLANVMAISKSIGEFKTAATGFDGVVTEPTMFLTGEAGPESVPVTPLTAGMN